MSTIEQDEVKTRQWVKGVEKRHIRLLCFMKVVMTVTFLAIWFLPPHHAAWVSALTNTIWLWEL